MGGLVVELLLRMLRFLFRPLIRVIAGIGDEGEGEEWLNKQTDRLKAWIYKALRPVQWVVDGVMWAVDMAVQAAPTAYQTAMQIWNFLLRLILNVMFGAYAQVLFPWLYPKKNYGVGVGKPWPGTTYLLPANHGTTAEEMAFDLTRTTGDPPYLVGLGNRHVGNHPKAKRLFNAGKTKYLEYYVSLQWTIREQPGTADFRWAYDLSNDLGDLPRMVKVTRTDDPTKAVYVSVLEAGPGATEGNGGLRNSGLSPAAMRALGFPGTLNPQHYGEYGWVTYEWAPGAPPGPA